MLIIEMDDVVNIIANVFLIVYMAVPGAVSIAVPT